MVEEAEVLFEELPSGEGCWVGHARLNRPGSLNALSLVAIELLTERLGSWGGREDIAAVLLTGEGEKAFCAGGDVQALYRAAVKNRDRGALVDDYPQRFFSAEYRLNYMMHRFPKPLICIGHGIVMGGGFGLFSASEFRIVTERSRLAFPEITIGLFPDAGGSWVLRQLPTSVAVFLGLTGSQVNATDALSLHMATHCIAHDARQSCLGGIVNLDFRVGQHEANRLLLGDYLAPQRHLEGMPASELIALSPEAVNLSTPGACVSSIFDLEGVSPWIDRGISNLRKGCPMTAAIVFEQLARVTTMTLADAFRMELTIACECLRRPDFVEGVRALLIDKDGTPNWTAERIEHIRAEDLDAHFQSSWAAHPLTDLEDLVW